MKNELPERKHPRLKNFDYSMSGAYFVTVCTHGKRCLLSRIAAHNLAPAEETEGLSPRDQLVYTTYGEIAEKQLLLLEGRYPHLKLGHYVIMPNHIHAILVIEGDVEPRENFDRGRRETSPRPTVMDIVCAYKSLVARECLARGFAGKLFQPSFFEHVIRNTEDYYETAKYICANPSRWFHDKLYSPM